MSRKSEKSNKENMDSPKSSTDIDKHRPENGKKVWSAKALVEIMKPSEAELKFRKEKSKDRKMMTQYLKSFKCTKCNRSFRTDSKEAENVQTHPCLGVLMCQDCCNYYESGEFSLDSEGEDKYCRWCGEGGTIFGCSKCICGFCVTCIKKHFGSKYLQKVKNDDDWLCFFCNPKPLWKHRHICSLAVQMAREKQSLVQSPRTEDSKKGSENLTKGSEKTDKEVSKPPLEYECDSDSSTSLDVWIPKSAVKLGKSINMKRVFTSSDEEPEITVEEHKAKKLKVSEKPSQQSSNREGNIENVKNLFGKMERILKLSEYQLTFGVNWCRIILQKLIELKCTATADALRDECDKMKWFFSMLSTSLVEFCNSVDSIEKSLQREDGQKDGNNVSREAAETGGFPAVVQFLAFLNTQVKTFMEKGLSLTDVLKGELYDDDKVIGIRKKPKSVGGSSRSPETGGSPVKNNCSVERGFEGAKRSNEEDEPKAVEEDSRDEDSFQLTIDENADPPQRSQESTDPDSSGATTQEKDSEKTSDPKEEILQILEILERA